MVIFQTIIPCFAAPNTISNIDQRIQKIKEEVKKLPSRVIYPVGGTFGHRWEIDSKSSGQSNWIKIHFPKSETLDNVIIIPEATFDTDKIRAYCLASEIRVTLLGSNKIVFEGKIPDYIHRNAEPILIAFQQPEKNVEGIRIDILAHQTGDPSLGFSEVFAFHKGLNVALGSQVVASSQHNGQEAKYLPRYITDGQSSLGQPILYKEEFRTSPKYSGFRSNQIPKSDNLSIELVLEKPEKIHEVRILPDYLPVNEMISFFYGFGYPPSIQLELLDKNKQVLEKQN